MPWVGFCEKDHDYVHIMEYGPFLTDKSPNKYEVCSKCTGACLIINRPDKDNPDKDSIQNWMTLEEVRDSRVRIGHIGFVTGNRPVKA